MTHVRDNRGAETRISLEINYEQAAAEAIHKVKQDLATKEIEQRLKQEIEKQKMNETLLMTIPKPEVGENLTGSGKCNILKMVTGATFGITKIGARIISIITCGLLKYNKPLLEHSGHYSREGVVNQSNTLKPMVH